MIELNPVCCCLSEVQDKHAACITWHSKRAVESCRYRCLIIHGPVQKNLIDKGIYENASSSCRQPTSLCFYLGPNFSSTRGPCSSHSCFVAHIVSLSAI